MRSRSILIAAALSLLAAQAVPAAARDLNDEQFYTSVGPWKITKRVRAGGIWECSAIMNDGVDALQVDYTPFVDRLYVGMSAWHAPNLGVGDIFPVSTRFSTALNGPFEHIDTAGKISHIAEGTDGRVVRIGYESSEAFLSSFAKARYVSFHATQPKQRLAMFDLPDNAEFVWQLRGCADSLKG
jgi:hypothetical protein